MEKSGKDERQNAKKRKKKNSLDSADEEVKAESAESEVEEEEHGDDDESSLLLRQARTLRIEVLKKGERKVSESFLSRFDWSNGQRTFVFHKSSPSVTLQTREQTVLANVNQNALPLLNPSSTA